MVSCGIINEIPAFAIGGGQIVKSIIEFREFGRTGLPSYCMPRTGMLQNSDIHEVVGHLPVHYPYHLCGSALLQLEGGFLRKEGDVRGDNDVVQ